MSPPGGDAALPPYAFEWDDQNVAHISRHGFIPDEVEELFAGSYRTRKSRESLYLAYGQTFEGRYTLVVYRRLLRRRIRIITARDMTKAEQRLYRKK